MSRYHNFTFTSYDLNVVECWKQSAHFKFICYSEEICPTTSRRHLQGYCGFKNARTLSVMIKRYPGPHFEPMRGRMEDNENYCSKAGELIKWGSVPQFNVQNGNDEKDRWKRTWELAKSGQLELIEPQILCSKYNSLARIASDYCIRPPRLNSWDELTCLWIWGKTDVGKSYSVWNQYENHPDGFYVKNVISKWWQHYRGEKVVILEEFPINKGFEHLTLLKLLADLTPLIVETKGGSCYCRPHTVIVTSNWSLDMCMMGEGICKEDGLAVLRRFKQIHKLSRDQIIDFSLYDKNKI